MIIFRRHDHEAVRSNDRVAPFGKEFTDLGAIMVTGKVEVTNIETQLPPVFDRFFGSLANRTCRNCGTVMERPK